MNTLLQPVPAAVSEASRDLSKAAVRAARLLEPDAARRVRGRSAFPRRPPRGCFAGKYLLSPDRAKEWEFALLFVRLFRSLQAIVGSHDRRCTALAEERQPRASAPRPARTAAQRRRAWYVSSTLPGRQPRSPLSCGPPGRARCGARSRRSTAWPPRGTGGHAAGAGAARRPARGQQAPRHPAPPAALPADDPVPLSAAASGRFALSRRCRCPACSMAPRSGVRPAPSWATGAGGSCSTKPELPAARAPPAADPVPGAHRLPRRRWISPR